MLKAAIAMKTDSELEGHCIDAKISLKAASEKVQTTVSENRYVYPRIDFSDGHFITYRVNNVQASFLVHQVLHTFTTALLLSVYAVFSLRLSVQLYLLSDDC